MSEIIDLTYGLSPETEMYPGLPQPEFREYFSVDRQGANVTHISFVSHVGTHIDAPAHVMNGGQTVDDIPLERMVGDAAILNITGRKDFSIITKSDLSVFDSSIHPGDRVIIITGIYKRYGTAEYNEMCPALAPEAAEWLVQKRIAAYATDATSIEVPGNSGNPMHHILLSHGIPIIENLANVDALTAKRVHLIALPVKLQGVDGGPCRVVALT